MSWSRVKNAFWITNGIGCHSVDIAVCKNCNGIHIPPEDANKCEKVVYETHEQLKKRYAHKQLKPKEEK